MRGITRPCRHTLGKELHERWRAHLCGLCLTLRNEAGQASRVLTGFDTLLISVLVEAQAGPGEMTTAGPCPLRGMRTAPVVPVSAPGTRLAAAGSLLAGAAGLVDKVGDGDLPGWTAPAATKVARRMAGAGEKLAAESGLDADVMATAARRAIAVEADPSATLEELLAPTGQAVAVLFAQTAVAAGRPGNQAALRRAGDAFGRLVHLLDAAADYQVDAGKEAFNPLAATSTPPAQARELARRLADAVQAALAEVEMRDGALADALFGATLDRAVSRALPEPGRPVARIHEHRRPRRRDHRPDHPEGHRHPVAGAMAGARAAMVAVGLPVLVGLGIFGGRRRRGGYYGDPYGPPGGYGYGYGRRRGPGCSCCDILACDCCANMACDGCCGEGGDDCCMCCA